MPIRFTLSALLLAALPLTLSAAPATDDWCADAVDFAMGTAQNRETGYSLGTINLSVEKDTQLLHKQVPALSDDDMRSIAATVYQKQWTRYGAANGMIATCLSMQQAHQPPGATH